MTQNKMKIFFSNKLFLLILLRTILESMSFGSMPEKSGLMGGGHDSPLIC